MASGRLTWLLLDAAAGETTARTLGQDYGNLVFCGVFVLAAMAVGIWWLRRG